MSFKKKLFTCLKLLILLNVVAYALMYVTDTRYLIKGVYSVYLQGRSTASIYDERFFDSRYIMPGMIQSNLKQRPSYKAALKVNQISTQALDDFHVKNKTRAFLVYHKGHLIQETYFKSHYTTTRSNSLSIAKSVVGSCDWLKPSSIS